MIVSKAYWYDVFLKAWQNCRYEYFDGENRLRY